MRRAGTLSQRRMIGRAAGVTSPSQASFLASPWPLYITCQQLCLPPSYNHELLSPFSSTPTLYTPARSVTEAPRSRLTLPGQQTAPLLIAPRPPLHRRRPSTPNTVRPPSSFREACRRPLLYRQLQHQKYTNRLPRVARHEQPEETYRDGCRCSLRQRAMVKMRLSADAWSFLVNRS